jgi:molecular chaperone GrpE
MMTKKQPINDDNDLQDILEELEEKQELEVIENKEITHLQAQLTEKEEIAKKAQIDYINLKADFDFLFRQTKTKEQSLEQDTIVKVVKKLIPFVEDLRKSLLHLTEEQKSEPLGKGVQMVYDKFLSALAELQIFPIESLGLEPDSLLHEPVSVQPIQDKKLKGKITQIFEQGFFLQTKEEKIVIFPSKVVIGS